jgi:hypothetical protein
MFNHPFFSFVDGPEFETSAVQVVNLETEVLKMIAMDCQIDGNPNPSYVWYEIIVPNGTINTNIFGQQNPYGQHHMMQPPAAVMPTNGLSVFATTRQIQRLYQNPGQHSMQCQAQSRGKTVKQQFLINVLRKFNHLLH